LLRAEARPLLNTYQLTNIDRDQVTLWVRQQTIDKTIEKALRGILAQKGAVSELDSKKEAAEDEMKQIYDDQQRLRENIKSLKGSSEEKLLIQRYTQQLNEQETRLEQLRKEVERLKAKQDTAQSALDRMIQELSFDVAG